VSRAARSRSESELDRLLAADVRSENRALMVGTLKRANRSTIALTLRERDASRTTGAVYLEAGHPDELGQSWDDLVGARGRNVFTDSSHKDHLHVGWGAA